MVPKSQGQSTCFPNCSVGYFKNYWEAVLDHFIKEELLSSVLNRDKNYELAFYLPQTILNIYKGIFHQEIDN